MSPIDAQRNLIDEIFTAALDLPESERDAYLDLTCRGRPEIRRAVDQLLKAAEGSEEGLSNPFDEMRNELFESLATDQAGEENLSGQRFNNWLLVEPIARGGLATVYLARRDDGEFEQTVAFKILRRGLDTDDLIARFRAERQILSTLEHPAIVQILDGGAIPDGRPFLVLEYVDGLPITDHCNQHGKSIRERVALVAEVLSALQHAHSRLVVHRDIKPSNIMVSRDGNVALLDFGIAKLLDAELIGGSSPRTRTGVHLLTPGYASPEQRAGKAVTTAADIYQVGVVLYELVTGQRPALADEEPLPPSHLVGDKTSRNEVRGDLDALIGKAMHPDPVARYTTASEMEADLRRFLSGQPIVARPDTLSYRLSKLVRRRPWLLPVGIAGALVLTAYVVTLTFYNRQLRLEQQRATAVQEFMVDLLSSPDPFAPADPDLGQQITVVDAIDMGQERIRGKLVDQPEIRASLLVSISSIYQSLGQHSNARDLREEALRLQQEIYQNESAPVIDSIRFLAAEHQSLGDSDRAEELQKQQLTLAEKLYPPGAPEIGVAQAAIGAHWNAVGRLDEARKMLESGIDKMRPHGVKYARPLLNAVATLSDRTIWDLPEEYLPMVIEARDLADQVYGSDSVQGAMARARLASTMSMLGDSEGAEKNFDDALATYDLRLGRSHEATLSALNNFSLHYMRNGQLDASEEMLREILDRQMDQFGENNRAVANSYQNLASIITRQRRFDDAIPLHWKAYELYRRILDENHYYTAFPLLSIAYGELQRDRVEAAEASAREAVERLQKSSLAGSSVEGIGRCLVARAIESSGRTIPDQFSLNEAQRLMQGGSVSEPYGSLCGLSPD